MLTIRVVEVMIMLPLYRSPGGCWVPRESKGRQGGETFLDGEKDLIGKSIKED